MRAYLHNIVFFLYYLIFQNLVVKRAVSTIYCGNFPKVKRLHKFPFVSLHYDECESF